MKSAFKSFSGAFLGGDFLFKNRSLATGKNGVKREDFYLVLLWGLDIKERY